MRRIIRIPKEGLPDAELPITEPDSLLHQVYRGILYVGLFATWLTGTLKWPADELTDTLFAGATFLLPATLAAIGVNYLVRPGKTLVWVGTIWFFYGILQYSWLLPLWLLLPMLILFWGMFRSMRN